VSKDCRHTITYLYGYVDGELEVETEHRLVNHFSYCPPCKNIEIVERRVRYTISPDARREVLKRLLEENHARVGKGSLA